MGILPDCMCVSGELKVEKRKIQFPGTQVTYNCKTPRKVLGFKPVSLEKQPLLIPFDRFFFLLFVFGCVFPC